MTIYEFNSLKVYIPEWEGEGWVIIESVFNKLRYRDNEEQLTHRDFYDLAKSMFAWSEDPIDWNYVLICDCKIPFDSTKTSKLWNSFYKYV